MDKKIFAQNMYNISSEDLGKVVQILDQRCEACIRKIDPEDLEIDIDTIDPQTFWTVDQFVKDCLPGKKTAKKASGSRTPGQSAGASAATSEPKQKKARPSEVK